MFGSDRFNDYVGRLATATSASVGDSPKVSVETARKIQKRRVLRLAVKLATKLEHWTKDDFELAKTMWKSECADLAKASYGVQLVHLIGKVYNLAATQFLGSADSGMGMPSMAAWAKNQQAKMERSRDKQQNKMDTLKTGMDMMSLQQKLQQEMENAKTDEEKKAVEVKMEQAMSETLLKIMWTTTSVDIANTLHEVVQLVVFDQSVDKEIRKKRADGIKNLGEIFMGCPAPEGEDASETDAKKLYEEAAFAAMLETIKKKEEAQQKAHMGH